MALIGSESYAIDSSSTVNQDIRYTVSDGSSSAPVYGNKIQLGSGSLTLNTADYGALGVAGEIASGAFALGQQAGDTARFALAKASEIVKEKAESDITKFSDPFIKVAGIVGIVLIAGFVALWAWFRRRKD